LKFALPLIDVATLNTFIFSSSILFVGRKSLPGVIGISFEDYVGVFSF
jgi:hypothetical protein